MWCNGEKKVELVREGNETKQILILANYTRCVVISLVLITDDETVCLVVIK